MNDPSRLFDRLRREYDQWFEENPSVYQSEILAIRQALPQGKKGIEIGVGTGRFAGPLNIKYGIEPSENMAKIAEQKGIKVYRAYAEKLPLEEGSFDFALMVTTVCFLKDIPAALAETHRILTAKGEIILAIIDKNSELGRKYEKGKSESRFYKEAHFHSTEELTKLLKRTGFHNFQYWQTLTEKPANPEVEAEQAQPGYGKGSFVVIKAKKA